MNFLRFKVEVQLSSVYVENSSAFIIIFQNSFQIDNDRDFSKKKEKGFGSNKNKKWPRTCVEQKER